MSSPKEGYSILPANQEAMQAGRGVCVAMSRIRKKRAEAQEWSRQHNNAGQMQKGSYRKTLGCLTLPSDEELHLPHVDIHACPHLQQAISTRYTVPFTTGTWHGACLRVYVSINTKPGFLGNQ